MSKEKALEKFNDVVNIYKDFLPKLTQLMNERQAMHENLPGDSDETYIELFHREAVHFKEHYSKEKFESLKSSKLSDDEYIKAATAFFIDYESISEYLTHVENLLEQN